MSRTRRDIIGILTCKVCLLKNAPPITKEEILSSIRKSKSNKASGPNNIPGYVLKFIEEFNLDVLALVFSKILKQKRYKKIGCFQLLYPYLP